MPWCPSRLSAVGLHFPPTKPGGGLRVLGSVWLDDRNGETETAVIAVRESPSCWARHVLKTPSGGTSAEVAWARRPSPLSRENARGEDARGPSDPVCFPCSPVQAHRAPAAHDRCVKRDLGTGNLRALFDFCSPKNEETMIYDCPRTFFSPN